MFAEDDDEQFNSPVTPSPGRSAHDHTFPATRRQLKPTPLPISDFALRPPQRPETVLEMTKPPQVFDTIIQRVLPAVPPTQEVPSTTEAPEIDTTAETTTTPVTEVTTETPDPDAEVCSERPFDSFMQLKNGSIYAFRGENYLHLTSMFCHKLFLL